MNFRKFKQNLKKLIELRAVDDASIVCTSISPNGEFLLYSTDESIRLFHLIYEVSTQTLLLLFIKLETCTEFSITL